MSIGESLDKSRIIRAGYLEKRQQNGFHHFRQRLEDQFWREAQVPPNEQTALGCAPVDRQTARFQTRQAGIAVAAGAAGGCSYGLVIHLSEASKAAVSVVFALIGLVALLIVRHLVKTQRDLEKEALCREERLRALHHQIASLDNQLTRDSSDARPSPHLNGSSLKSANGKGVEHAQQEIKTV